MSAGWIPLLAVLVFPLMWGGTCWIIGQMGWGRLAARYRTEAAGTGRAFRFVSGSIGLANYNGALTVHVEPGGLRLAVLPLFRPGTRRSSSRGARSPRSGLAGCCGRRCSRWRSVRRAWPR